MSKIHPPQRRVHAFFFAGIFSSLPARLWIRLLLSDFIIRIQGALNIYTVRASGQPEVENPEKRHNPPVHNPPYQKMILYDHNRRDKNSQQINNSRPEKLNPSESGLFFFKESLNAAPFQGNGAFPAVIGAVTAGAGIDDDIGNGP
jgi:hypothetical protein